MMRSSDITALIITYAPDQGVLQACVDSLRKQTPQPKIIIADNLAKSDPQHKVALSFKAEDTDVITYNGNFGFGGAINRALPQIKSPFIIISNFDIVYDPGWVDAALTRLRSSNKDVIGIACKTLFYPPGGDPDWPGLGPNDPKPTSIGTGAVLDNTGTLVNGLMLAYNRGVGQIDIGQYDSVDRPMGACFAAFLTRTQAFRPISEGGVGSLDAGYFMYYEDIDWCYRANVLGFKIIYEPKAIAWHHHSLTTRGMSLFFKYHLIQRNLYRTIIKNMKFRTFVKLWLLHARLHIRRAKIEKDFVPVTQKILTEALLWIPSGLFKRISIQLNRKVSDTDIVNLSVGEEGHLDDVTLRPQADWRNVLASLERLRKTCPDAPSCAMIPVIKELAESPDLAQTMEVRKLAVRHCPSIVVLIDQILKN